MATDMYNDMFSGGEEEHEGVEEPQEEEEQSAAEKATRFERHSCRAYREDFSS
ncbi:hypothetical protein KIN20_018378 [Parelaphostrongylus tenuis]|uniref:Uncharacterized protein n=1 Tax=Parelaphostrongylus tenuis TaxID=148309 RepID=A0AAD5QRF0_PARTN|nr:hypothetical protein KIN20_018378 [Parelaphostrongylus tenuis]